MRDRSCFLQSPLYCCTAVRFQHYNITALESIKEDLKLKGELPHNMNNTAGVSDTNLAILDLDSLRNSHLLLLT